jgi:hypothetical protein
MRHLLVIAAVAGLAAGCTKPCEELGNRICKCYPTGVSTDTCERQVGNQLDAVDPTKSQEEACSDYLDSCDAPSGISFCDWLASAEGKASCGLAY